MHATSLENMRKCHDRYVAGNWLERRDEVQVLDIGGADVNGSYRDVFRDPRMRYRAADLQAGPGVDLVLDDPYRLPLPDASQDLVLSGQMLEHCEFFWLAFAEMIRVLKPDGMLFLIAPSAGPIHRYPVDCYRFYPDAYRALAKHAGVHLVDVWMDERGPWGDLVGVFSPTARDAVQGPVVQPQHPSMRFEAQTSPEAPEEAVRGQARYLDVLRMLHARLQPRGYVEIGVRRGASLRLAQCPALGIDPDAEPEPGVLGPDVRISAMASDDYFEFEAARALPVTPDLAFIDGMHQFEFALRDFMNIERRAHPGSLVLIDDVFPNHPAQAERERRTRVWTGDVWKLRACLAERRPDLVLVPVDTSPSGLLLIAGLDPGNRVLWQQYNPVVRRYRDLELDEAVLSRTGALAPDDPRLGSLADRLRQLRESDAKRSSVLASLRAVLAGA